MQHWFYEQLAMYAAYHQDSRNKATHHVGVPLIVFSLLVLTAGWPVISLAGISVSAAGVLIGVLLLGYLVCVPRIGLVAVGFYGLLLWLAERLAADEAGGRWLVFIVAFVLGWMIQFVGHAFEGRRPALFDNLLQIFVAPAFLIAELFFALGLETRLLEEINRRSPRYHAQS